MSTLQSRRSNKEDDTSLMEESKQEKEHNKDKNEDEQMLQKDKEQIMEIVEDWEEQMQNKIRHNINDKQQETSRKQKEDPHKAR